MTAGYLCPFSCLHVKFTYEVMVMQNTYSVEEIEKIQSIIALIGEDVPYEDALAAYDEIMMKGSLD